MEVPDGVEPTISELQSLALPLGYGTAAQYIIAKALFFFNERIAKNVFLRSLFYFVNG